MSIEISRRHVAQEVPDASTLAEHGIDLTVAQAQLVLALASRLIVHGTANHRVAPGRATRLIALGVALPLEDEDQVVLDPLLPRPPDAFIPNGETAEKKLTARVAGFTPSALNRAWDKGSAARVTSCLPLEIVLEYLPARCWRYLAAFVECGPYEAAERIAAAASEYGQQMNAKSLDAQLSPVTTFMKIVATLRADYESASDLRKKTGRPPLVVPPSLAQWTFAPAKLSVKEIKAKAVGGRKLETSAVPAQLVKQRLHELARDAEWSKWWPEEWPFNKNWKALKDFALLALLACLAPRIEHLAYLDARDFVLDCTFRDGSRGAALLFRGGDRGLKGRDDAYEFAVRLPDALRDILVAWLRCNANEPSAQASSGQTPRSYEGTAPLIPVHKKRSREDRQYCHDNLGERVRGRQATANSLGNKPLVPKTPGSFEGYQAHRFRSTHTQEIERLVKVWRAENPGAEHSGYHDVVFAELPLDHADRDLGYRDLRDAAGEPTARFEQIVALAVKLRWDDLWGDGPYLRRGLDPTAIREAHESVELLDAEIEMLSRQVARLRQQASLTLENGLKRPAVNDRLEGLLQAHALRNEVDAKVERREHLRNARAAALVARDEACETSVLLPEDLSAEGHARQLAEVLAMIEGREAAKVEPVSTLPLATELTVGDVATLFGVTTQHVGRWRNGQSNPPIDPTRWVEHSKKDFRYPASALDHEALHRVPAEDPRQRVNSILARRALLGYARQRPTTVAA